MGSMLLATALSHAVLSTVCLSTYVSFLSVLSSNVLSRSKGEEMAAVILTQRQLLILRKMARGGGRVPKRWSIKELHDIKEIRDEMSMYTLGNIIDCLQRRGYIQREFMRLQYQVTTRGRQAVGHE